MAALKNVVNQFTQFKIGVFSKSIIVNGSTFFFARTPDDRDLEEIERLINQSYLKGVADTQQKIKEAIGVYS